MGLPVVYRRKVGRDLAGGYAWYNGQHDGLGEEFLTAVNTAFDTIERFPDIFARVHGEVRRAVVSRFPTLSSTASKPSALWYSQSCTRPVIRKSGPSRERSRANKRMETDLRKRALPACSVAHARRREKSFAQSGTWRLVRGSSLRDLAGRSPQCNGPPQPSEVRTSEDACGANT